MEAVDQPPPPWVQTFRGLHTKDPEKSIEENKRPQKRHVFQPQEKGLKTRESETVAGGKGKGEYAIV